MPITWLARIISAVNSNVKPSQINLGVCFALLLALIPASVPAVPSANLLWIVLFAATFFIKVNQAIECAFLAIFKLLVPLLDPVISAVGYAVLTLPFLHGFFTAISNVPILYFFHLNHTLVMGGLVLGLVLFAPFYLLCGFLLRLYRDRLREKIANSRPVKAFLKLPLVNKLGGIYSRAAGFYAGIR